MSSLTWLGEALPAAQPFCLQTVLSSVTDSATPWRHAAVSLPCRMTAKYYTHRNKTARNIRLIRLYTAVNKKGFVVAGSGPWSTFSKTINALAMFFA